MAGFSVGTNEHLIRSNLWSSQIKEVLLEDLMAMKYVDMITDFPDGNTINIPSIGLAEVQDYIEGQPIKYTSLDTGNFTFSVDQYKAAGTYITEQMKQDSFYAARLAAKFVPSQARAIAKAMEVKILAQGPSGQTAGSRNLINNAAHRMVGSGAANTIGVKDFALAKYALQKANVPMTNLVAFVDPSVEYALATQTNLTNLSYNPMWEGVVRDGMSTGTKFKFNIYGFDVYTTPNLATLTASETVNSVTAPAGSVQNLFFSAAPDVLPIVGLVRQAPKVDSEYNKDFQREEYVTTCRYAFKLFRPENMVTVITDPAQVS